MFLNYLLVFYYQHSLPHCTNKIPVNFNRFRQGNIPGNVNHSRMLVNYLAHHFGTSNSITHGSTLACQVSSL